MQYRPGYPQTSTAIQEEIWIDVSKRVDYQSLQWEQQATEQNTALRFDIFTMLSLSSTRYDDYASWGTSGNGLDAYTNVSLGMVDAINDPSFFIDIANRTEVKVQEWALVSGHYEVVRTLWGGVVSSVDTERQGDAFVVQRVECADYTALLDELIIRDYNAPTVSAVLGERPTISGLTTEVIAGGLTLTAGPYTFRVVAYNASDEIVEIFTHVSQNLTATDIDPPGISDPELRTIRLNWSTVAGATYYKVFAKSGIGVKDMYYKATVTSPAATYSLSTAPAVSGDLSPEDKVQKGSIDVDIISGSSDPENANYKGIFNGLDPDLDPGIDNQTAYVETAKKLNDGTPDPDKSYRFSPTLETGIVLTSPFGGKTLKQALNIIIEKTGGVFWVDANKDLHYTNKQARELVENPRFESSPASSGYSVAGGHSILQDRGPYGYGRALVASAGATTAESQTSAVPVTANQYYFARTKGWAKTNFASDWEAELRFYSNLAGTTQVGNSHKLQRNISFDSTDDGRWCKAWVMAQAHATAVTARIVFMKKRNDGDEVAWTDFSLVKITGTMGFSDNASETAYALPMKAFETPKAPRSASKVANRLLVYGVYKDANNPSELESVETDISLTLRKVAAGTLAAAKYYVRVVATVGTTEIICKYATETITDQDVIDGNRELYASWAAVTGASSYKIYVGTKRFAMRLKATQPGTTLSIQSPAAGGAAISLEPSVYYYKVFDFAPGIWEAGGKIIEAAINDSLVDNDDKASTRALSFWEEKGIAERTWEFDTFETEVPMVGEVIPFVWVADDTAEPLMVKGIKAKLLGDRVYYTVTVGDDPLLTKRGVTQIFADMQAATARLNDTIAPEAPQALAVTAPVEALLQTPDGVTRASVTAQWTPSPEDDFAHYSVEYGYDPEFTEVQRANVSQTSDSQSASTGVKANVVHTFQAEPGKKLYYRVAAIDNTNNKSPWSSEEIDLPQDITPCEPPYNVLVAPGLKSNTVTWQFDFYNPDSPLLNRENTDFARFRVYRRVHNTGAYAVIAETSATQYVDTDFDNYSAGYNYAVTSLDRTGNQSGVPASGGATGVAYNTTSNVPSKIDGGVDITTASITGAEIANATITDANIDSLSATKITAGTLNVSTGMTIVSDGTAAAPQFEVDKDGVTIRDDLGNVVLQVNGSTATLNADFIDVNGITATEITVGTGNGVVRVGNYPDSLSPTFQGIWGGNANPSSAAFTLNTSGILTATSASISGSVSASSGAIGGWAIESDKIYKATAVSPYITGIYTGTSASSGLTFFAGAATSTGTSAAFAVTNDGAVTATNANISGTISASAGTIGGFTIGADSLTAGDGATAVGISPASYPFFAGSSTASTAPFSVTSAGVLTATSASITGSVTANSGTVGGWTLSSTSLTAGSGESAVGIATSGGYAFYAGDTTASSAEFRVTPEGLLTATSASITGSVTANSGAIGGWSLTSTSLSGGNTTISSTGDITVGSGESVARLSSSDAAYRLWLGGSAASTAPFRVNSTGAVTATDANISGTISASAGQIGGFTIGATSLTAGSGATAVGISPASYPFFAGSSTASTAPFSVTSAGVLTATSASITGAVTATSGSIGGWILSSTSLTGGDTTISSAGDITVGSGANIARLSSSDPAYRLWLGGTTASTAPFRVTSTGSFVATSANVTGTISTSNITATGGTVGGWTLSSSSLTAGSGENTVGINATGVGPAIFAGSSSGTAAPFQVSKNGAVQAKNITVLGGEVLIGKIGPEITEISLAATTGIVTVTTTTAIDADEYSVGTKILVDVSGTYGSDTWANGYFVIASVSGSTLTYESNNLVDGLLSDSSATGRIYLGSQMAVGGDGGSAAAWMTVEGNKFALRNPADPLVTVIEATAGAVTINADFINAGSINISGLDANALTATNFSVTNAGVMTAGSGNNVAVISPTDATYRLWLGHSTGAAAPFSVTSTGAISATSGAVGGWTLSSTSLTGGNTIISSAGDITLGTGSNVARLSSTDPAYRLWLGGSTASTAPFRVTSTGSFTATDANITGAVSASSGQIGGFTIGATSLTAGSGATAVGIVPASFPFFAGSSTASTAPFRVTSAGVLTATGVDITGTITANSGSFTGTVSTSNITATGGTVGGWSLSSTSLTGGNTTIASAGDITLGTGENVARLSSSDPAYRLWLGGSTASTAPFRVTSTGAVTANDANISGTVTATSGAIGGWVLSSTSFTGGDTTINSAGDITLGTGSNVARLSSSDPAYRLWLGGSTASTAPFRVTSAGELTATSASITGTITANSGAIGTWTISSDAITSIDNGGDYSGLYHSDLDSARAFFAGASSASGASASFYVQNDGSLYANSATISGSITATSGSIGTWTIDDDGISSIDVGGEYSGLYHSDANAGRAFFAGATSQSGTAAKFYVQNDGALYAESATITGAVTATSGSFTGTISASAGQIGGWAIGSDRITNLGATKYAGIIDTALDTDLAFFAGATSSSGASAFYSVTNAGALTATNATISGSVTATVGAIGGWSLTSTSLTSSNTTISSTGDITLGTGSNVARLSSSDAVYRLWLGATTGSAAPFSVTSTGSISASAGTIGGFSLSSTSLTAGTGASAVGLLPGTFPFFAGSSTASSAPFRVTSAGDLTATNVTVVGTDATLNGVNTGKLTLQPSASQGGALILTDGALAKSAGYAATRNTTTGNVVVTYTGTDILVGMFITTAPTPANFYVVNAKVTAVTSGVSFTYQMPTGTTASGTITSFTAYKTLQLLGGGLTRFQQTTSDAGAVATGSLILGNKTGLDNIGLALYALPADGELVFNTVLDSSTTALTPKYTGGGNLYQSATNVLRTSGAFLVGTSLGVGTDLSVSGAATITGNISGSDIIANGAGMYIDATTDTGTSALYFRNLSNVAKANISVDTDAFVTTIFNFGTTTGANDNAFIAAAQFQSGGNIPVNAPTTLTTIADASSSGARWHQPAAGARYELKRSTSSARYKNTIQHPDAELLAVARNIQPRFFKRNDETSGRRHLGFIAEEVHAAGLLEGVTYFDPGDGPVIDGIESTAILAAALMRIKDLEDRLAAIEGA